MLPNTGSFYREEGDPASLHAVVGNALRTLGGGSTVVTLMKCEVALPTHLSLTGLNPGPQVWHWKEPSVLMQTPLGQELGSLHSSISVQGEGGT